MRKYKFSSSFILYYPNERVYFNISKILPFVDKIYLIDNTPVPKIQANFQQLIKNNEKIAYSCYFSNKGIAKALNDAANYAIEDHFDFLLTLDQDSEITDDFFVQLDDFLNQYSMDNIGILSPFHANRYRENKNGNIQYQQIDATMTSGNLLNLLAYQKVGKFEEKLFIDYVDIEYCLRMRKVGFKIIQNNKMILNHELGWVSKHRLLWKTLLVTNHDPQRRYYITRNRLFVINKYKFSFFIYALYEIKNFFKDILKIICFEKQKGEKLRMILKGMRDFIYNNYN